MYENTLRVMVFFSHSKISKITGKTERQFMRLIAQCTYVVHMDVHF